MTERTAWRSQHTRQLCHSFRETYQRSFYIPLHTILKNLWVSWSEWHCDWWVEKRCSAKIMPMLAAKHPRGPEYRDTSNNKHLIPAHRVIARFSSRLAADRLRRGHKWQSPPRGSQHCPAHTCSLRHEWPKTLAVSERPADIFSSNILSLLIFAVGISKNRVVWVAEEWIREESFFFLVIVRDMRWVAITVTKLVIIRYTDAGISRMVEWTVFARSNSEPWANVSPGSCQAYSILIANLHFRGVLMGRQHHAAGYEDDGDRMLGRTTFITL